MESYKKNIIGTSHIYFAQIASSIIFIPIFINYFGLSAYALYTVPMILHLYIGVFEQPFVLRYLNSKDKKLILTLSILFWLGSVILNLLVLQIFFNSILVNYSYQLSLYLSCSASLIVFQWLYKIKGQLDGNFILISNLLAFQNIVRPYLSYFLSDSIESFFLFSTIFGYLFISFFLIKLIYEFKLSKHIFTEIKNATNIIKLNVYGLLAGNIDKFMLPMLINEKLFALFMLLNNVAAYIRIIPRQIDNVFYVQKNLKLKALNLKLNTAVIIFSIVIVLIIISLISSYHEVLELVNKNIYIFLIILIAYSLNSLYATLLNYKIIESKEGALTELVEKFLPLVIIINFYLIYNYDIYGAAYGMLFLNTTYFILYLKNEKNNCSHTYL